LLSNQVKIFMFRFWKELKKCMSNQKQLNDNIAVLTAAVTENGVILAAIQKAVGTGGVPVEETLDDSALVAATAVLVKANSDAAAFLAGLPIVAAGTDTVNVTTRPLPL
jgi:hypothetical protein